MVTIIPNPPTKSPAPDPEDNELNGRQMSFLEHLEELRRRILRSVIAIVVASGICFYFRNAIYAYLALPLTQALQELHLSTKLAYFNPVDPFNFYVKMSLITGLFLASPFVLWQIWMFISPGLYRHEKRYVWPFVLLTSGLFISGGLFAYKLALPKALYFLVGFGQQFQPVVEINEYWNLAFSIIIAVGLVFELPVAIMVLSFFGIVTPKFLLKNIRYAVLLTAVAAAAIVPSNDLASIFVVWIPLVGLYLLSIGLSWLVHFRKRRRRQHELA
jgi:sec-independent protein translocase protein TatC